MALAAVGFGDSRVWVLLGLAAVGLDSILFGDCWHQVSSIGLAAFMSL